MAKGKSVTSKRGILGPHEEVKPEDLGGGKDSCEAFVKSGHFYSAAKSKPQAEAAKAEKAKAPVDDKKEE